ncbi:MAG: EnvZ/OmpR regulon moderator MzrA [Enterobacter hormaechei]|nr:EnvZ/OmpR regulon moderator MzrA [Enterobacter hormaechei]
MVISPLAMRRFSYAIVALMMFSALILLWSALQHQESTLAIRPVSQGTSVPDGFSIWNGIRFKSITPQDDVLLIKFDSSAQSAAAKAVLDRTLPQGYIIAQQDDDSHVASWMSRLRDTSHRFG